jgi:hypothetical protein
VSVASGVAMFALLLAAGAPQELLRVAGSMVVMAVVIGGATVGRSLDVGAMWATITATRTADKVR